MSTYPLLAHLLGSATLSSEQKEVEAEKWTQRPKYPKSLVRSRGKITTSVLIGEKATCTGLMFASFDAMKFYYGVTVRANNREHLLSSAPQLWVLTMQRAYIAVQSQICPMETINKYFMSHQSSKFRFITYQAFDGPNVCHHPEGDKKHRQTYRSAARL